nr:immunoglobulin heavy chain junction region [Macaca mulatta]
CALGTNLGFDSW